MSCGRKQPQDPPWGLREPSKQWACSPRNTAWVVSHPVHCLFLPFSFFFFFKFLPSPPWYMEFPRPGIESEHSCYLCHSCGNTRSFTPLSQARDGT